VIKYVLNIEILKSGAKLLFKNIYQMLIMDF
jgi:hypothetical protein